MNEWNTNLRTLDWLPWTDEIGKTIEARPPPPSSPQSERVQKASQLALEQQAVSSMSMIDTIQNSIVQNPALMDAFIQSSGGTGLDLDQFRELAAQHGVYIPGGPPAVHLDASDPNDEDENNPGRLVAIALSDAYLAKRSIYRESGWPDAFDGDGFLSRQEAWSAERSDIMSISNGPRDMLAGRRLRDFYRRTAGV